MSFINFESCWCISKPFRHYQPLKRTIVGSECNLPFISRQNLYKMVHVPEVDLGVDLCFLWCIYEVRNEQKWVLVFLGNSVEASEIDTKSKRAIFLLNNKDWS